MKDSGRPALLAFIDCGGEGAPEPLGLLPSSDRCMQKHRLAGTPGAHSTGLLHGGGMGLVLASGQTVVETVNVNGKDRSALARSGLRWPWMMGETCRESPLPQHPPCLLPHWAPTAGAESCRELALIANHLSTVTGDSTPLKPSSYPRRMLI